MKPYLVFMAGQNSLEDISELVEPIKPYIRGVCALLHDSDEFSPEAIYLLKINNELGAGNLVFSPYVGDHSYSRNHILRETGLKKGDRMVSIDTMERCPTEFAENFDYLFTQMEFQSIDVADFYGKPYLIRYREDMIYFGTPHESLVAMNLLGKQLGRIELNQYYKDENKVRINTRPLKRNKDHHICHYITYLLQPNSNQNALGLEHHGGSLARYEELRENLLKSLDLAGLDRTVNGVKCLLNRPLDEITRPIVNEIGWVNNFYRNRILGQEVEDTHNWSSLPQF